jgi:hypothetical protein
MDQATRQSANNMALCSENNLVKETESLLASVKSYNGDRGARLALVKQLELLRLQIEDPMDSMITEWEHVRHPLIITVQKHHSTPFSRWKQLSVAVATNVMIQMGVFDKLPLQGSMTAEELAAVVGKDESVTSQCSINIVINGSVFDITSLHH